MPVEILVSSDDYRGTRANVQIMERQHHMMLEKERSQQALTLHSEDRNSKVGENGHEQCDDTDCEEARTDQRNYPVNTRSGCPTIPE